jgi:hypothetical protein
MVCPAAPIPATQPPTTCHIACDGGGASGRKLARACKPCNRSERVYRYRSKRPSTPTIQPRNIVTRRKTCPTRFRQPRVSALRPSRSPGALYLQRLRFQTLPSAKAWQQLVAANLRPPTTQHVMREEATQDEDATRG